MKQPTQHTSTIGILRWTMLLSAVFFLIACSSKQEPYPNLITEFGNLSTNSEGTFIDMVTDNGQHFNITNTNIKKHRPDTTYRAIIGYSIGSTAKNIDAYIHSLKEAFVLGDSSNHVLRHPTGIESMWIRGKYINMQLSAKSQGKKQYWGYCIDDVQNADGSNRPHSHYHISIHHNQNNDLLSYTETYYCSIYVPSIPLIQHGDTITVAVNTFNGIKKWTFKTSL